jgi:hypothetical protein
VERRKSSKCEDWDGSLFKTSSGGHALCGPARVISSNGAITRTIKASTAFMSAEGVAGADRQGTLEAATRWSR